MTGTTDYSTLGEMLRVKRQQAGRTQEQVGELLGVSTAAYNQWELGRSEPSPGRLPAVADHLGISLEEVEEMLSTARAVASRGSADDVERRVSRLEQEVAELQGVIRSLRYALGVSDVPVPAAPDRPRPEPAIAADRTQPSSVFSEAAHRAHETISGRRSIYERQIRATPDFEVVCPEAPPLDTLSAQQLSYWKATYTKRGGEARAW